MASDGQGTIYIPLEEFWEFVAKYSPATDGEIVYGKPRIGDGASDLEIDYAFSDTECHPKDWTTPPPAVTQWRKP